MLPISNNASPEAHKKPKTPEFLDRKNSFNSVVFHHHHPRIWLLLSILSIQILLLLTLRSVPLSLSLPHPTHHSFPAPKTANSTSAVPKPEPEDQCSSGRVFVYDLPETFNSEILAKCDRLNPWSSRCDALANGGLGPIATGLSGIVPENLAEEPSL